MARGVGMYKAIAVTRGIFSQEMRKARVLMGYVLGIAVLAGELNAFLGYVAAGGEPVNILETFIVAEHTRSGAQFLLLGYLLVIASAPFIRADTHLVLYRSSRRIWNGGAILYVLLQAFLYVLFLAGVCVAVSCPVGFLGNTWSRPVHMLAIDSYSMLAVRYGVDFSCRGMMQSMTVPQAFGITFLYLFGYLVFLGVLFYLCNLALRSFWGLVAVAGIHLGGYFLPFYLVQSPRPGYYVDGGNGHWMPLCRYLVFIVICVAISFWAVKRIDMLSGTEGEG